MAYDFFEEDEGGIMSKKEVVDKTHVFSIWLLRNDITPDWIYADMEAKHLALFKIIENVQNAPQGSSAVYWQVTKKNSKIWWQEYWGIEGTVSHIFPNAIIFIPSSNRWFAISQGYASKYIKTEYIDTQFSFYTALNMVEPEKLTATKVYQPDASLRQLNQINSGTSLLKLPMYDVFSTSIIRDVAGIVKPSILPLLKSVNGGPAKALMINATITPNQFDVSLAKFLELSESQEFKEHFEFVNNISEVKNTEIQQNLDSMLESTIIKRDFETIQVGLPEITDQFGWIWKLSPLSGEFLPITDLTSDFIFSQIGTEVITCDELKRRFKILAKEDEDSPYTKSFNLYKCIVFEARIKDETQYRYFLIEGTWYEVKQDLLNRIDNTLNSIESEEQLPFSIPPFLSLLQDSGNEGSYNIALASKLHGICLDKKNFSPRGQTQIEPCDVLLQHESKLYFMHNKVFRSSSELSHLFSQSLNSARLFLNNQDSRRRIKTKIQDSNTQPELITQFQELVDSDGQITVVLGIIEKPSISHTIQTLPLFSKMSLLTLVRSLKEMRVTLVVTFIPYE